MRTTPALALLASLLLSSAAPAATIRVDLNGGGDYLTIGEAIEAAVEGDTLLVAPGEYVGTNNRNMDPLGKDLTIVGTAGSESTIINCENAGRGFTFLNSENSTYVVGLTILDGDTDGEVPGGSVVCDGASPTFLDCVFLSSFADAGGGAVQCVDASPTFQDCQFIDNRGRFGGGLISKGSSHPVLTDVLFEGNDAAWTGGMRCEGGGATLTNVTFRDNRSSNTGGGFVGAGEGNYSIAHCVFVGNVAEDGIGGGVACGAGTLSVSNCTFSGNSATSGSAAGVKDETGVLLIDTSILAFGLGPDVLACDAAPPTVTHCCVFGNAGGDSLCGDYSENLFLNPMFCDEPGGVYTLYDVSVCLPVNNPWGASIGALDEGCVHPGPLLPPDGLTAVSGDESATVRWRPVVSDIFDHFRLERDDSSLFGTETVVFTTADTVVVDAPLLDGVRYYYRVFSVDEFGVDSVSSDTVSCLIVPTPPGAPADLAAVAGDLLVELSWRANPEHDLDHYAIYRDTVGGFTPGAAYATSSENTFSDTAVANYTRYYYRVAAVDTTALVSGSSSEVRAVPHGKPPAVAWLQATPGDTSASLTWRSVEPPCEQDYKVYRDTTPDMLSLTVFYDGFEMYAPNDPPPSPPWSMITQTGTEVRVSDSFSALGARSVALRDSSSGYLRLFASLGDSGHRAPRVKFKVRPGAGGPETNLVQFEIFGEAGIGYPAGVLEVCDGRLRHWVVGSDPETLANCEPEAWHDVEWYFDCESDTYGVWLDGQRLAGGVPFFNDAEQLEIIEMRTRFVEHGSAWVDEIFVGGHVQSITAIPDTTFLDEPLLAGVKYYYKVTVVDTFGSEGLPSEVVAVVPGWVGIDDGDEAGSAVAFLRPGSPNPFGTHTSLRYGVPSSGSDVLVRIFDISGRLVKTLVDERQDGGVYGLVWDGRTDCGDRSPSGVYFIMLEASGFHATRKLVLLK